MKLWCLNVESKFSKILMISFLFMSSCQKAQDNTLPSSSSLNVANSGVNSNSTQNSSSQERKPSATKTPKGNKATSEADAGVLDMFGQEKTDSNQAQNSEQKMDDKVISEIKPTSTQAKLKMDNKLSNGSKLDSKTSTPASSQKPSTPATPPEAAAVNTESATEDIEAPDLNEFLNNITAHKSKTLKVKMLHVQLGGEFVFNFLKAELKSRPYQKMDLLKTYRPSGNVVSKDIIENVDIQEIQLPHDRNPFAITKYNYDVGQYRPYNLVEKQGPPVISEDDAQWFQEQLDMDMVPDVLYIGGHQVPGMGWHGEDLDSQEMYIKNIYLPTLIASVKKYPAMKKYFSKIKMVFIGGCWALANLEPHGPHGEFLTPDQINKIYHSGPEGKASVIGNIRYRHSLEYQRNHLATVYDGDFTRGTKREICSDKDGRHVCEIFNVDRVLPDYALWDGSHMYNYPFIMKRLFSGAYFVFGFHSPSPENDKVVPMYRQAFKNTFSEHINEGGIQKHLDAKKVPSLLALILSDKISENEKKELIQSMRVHWTLATDELNRHRPAGSITPRYPELDENGPFAVRSHIDWAPEMAPYELRK